MLNETADRSPHRRGLAAAVRAALGVALVVSACDTTRPDVAPPAAAPPADTVSERGAPQDSAAVSAAPATSTGSVVLDSLEALVRGPTAAERAAGAESWFSEETAGVVRSVDVDSRGHAIVDFDDLREVIPNASSSAGSAMLLEELNATMFDFPEIRSVEYRMEGSCDLFWDWLQYGCQIVDRPGS